MLNRIFKTSAFLARPRWMGFVTDIVARVEVHTSNWD